LNKTTRTNEKGEFVLLNLPFTRVAVVVAHEEGTASDGLWLTPRKEDETVYFVLPASSKLQVYVTNEQYNPVPDSEVNLTNGFFYNPSKPYEKTLSVKKNLIRKTDASGMAYFDKIRILRPENRQEKYWLLVKHPEYGNELKYPLDIKEGQNVVTITLRKKAQAATVIGKLVGTAGQSIANAAVTGVIETFDKKPFLYSLKTDEAGMFILTVQGKSDVVKDGVYQANIFIQAWIEGYKPTRRLLTSALKEREVLDVGTIELPPGNRMAGYVFDETGRPIKDATVVIEKAGKMRTEQSLRLKTDTQGYFLTNAIGDEYYDLFVESNEYPAGTVSLNDCLRLNVPPNTTSISFHLKKAK
jgi:hypothetical protein